VAVVSIRKALQIALVKGFRGVKPSGGNHFGDNLSGPPAGCVHGINAGNGRLPLGFRSVENGRSVLGAMVITLTVASTGVMHLEEKCQQFFKAGAGRIKCQADGLCMAGAAAAN
jgi:hypothetical protein